MNKNDFRNIVSVTELRRNFGEITANLAKIDFLLLIRGGEPFAILKAAPEEKRKVLRKAVGAWKGTSLDSDVFWKKVLKRKSRRTKIRL